MTSAKLILLTAIACSVTGCAGSTRLLAPAEPCSSLVPVRMAEPTPSAVIGATGDPALDAQTFGIEQTGQLRLANRDKADSMAIVKACEARDAAAARHINAPFWAFWR